LCSRPLSPSGIAAKGWVSFRSDHAFRQFQLHDRTLQRNPPTLAQSQLRKSTASEKEALSCLFDSRKKKKTIQANKKLPLKPQIFLFHPWPKQINHPGTRQLSAQSQHSAAGSGTGL
jgi:hypothetical protein